MIRLLQVEKFPILMLPEIEAYLESGLFRGIGKKTAQTLVNCFGSETLSILDNNPEKLYTVPGLTQYRIDGITKAWSESKKNPNLGVITQLLAVGTSLKLALKICDYYGHKTANVLQNNPYRLIDDIDGIGFKTADELAISLGIPLYSDTRYISALIHVLKSGLREGNCFLPFEQLVSIATDLLSSPQHTPDVQFLNTIIQQLLSKGTLVSGDVGNSVYLKAAYRAELSVALKILALLDQPTHPTEHLEHWLAQFQTTDYRQLSRLSDEQISALMMAAKHPISIITGGPGRGKTYVLKTLVEWFIHTDKAIALAAPTGKAANRMKDATGIEATTIHRLLQWQGNNAVFLHNEDNPLNLDCLIVDEFSMVDIFLFNSLLKALPKKTRIVLVGDFDQLPSIGAGMVLRDLIVSELVPTTFLQTIYRQRHESPIIYAANDVNSGIVPTLHNFNQVSDWMDVGDCAMIQKDSPQATSQAIVELVKAIGQSGVDLNQQLIILAPQKQGDCGVHNLNQLLAPIFNPKQENQPQVVSGSVIYRVGDRVIQLKNRYETVPPVMNGEIGQVIAVEPEKFLVTISWEGGAVVNYYPGDFEQIMHSFCITCHKSQGSQFPYVIFPLVRANYRMLTRQLLYTTMTRAMGTFIAVGQHEALKTAVATDKPAQRFTGLTNLLISPVEQLSEIWQSLSNTRKTTCTITSSPTVTVASRLQQRQLTATPGQMTTIGSLALQMYESKYGYRPSKQPELVGKFRFNTYHYETTAIELIDSAIDAVLLQ
ncbi:MULTISPECIES: SF1B family DNA helicase RecD2 [Nostoc]|uniref:ATP-dependent RecD-like DNA helicase n=3 Tax=Nostoc TaxID=1177 RepID=A0ABR8IJP1_9NOSO|nr:MULTISPECIES: ATP-dependent RecD-like DNA helicase [Nostoc]MBD2565428.1 ATP-dependent RecD-like DNA helicase [Nostoc linckia FACHB-391]MBD2650958.1 ATP-dependent RecD-like DNA helicase [Nostoc foliaceum FACHB-393]